MSKKWIGVLVGIWIIAAICGTTYFNLVKKDKGIRTFLHQWCAGLGKGNEPS
mgnify:CR=1 FL=1